MAEFAALPLFTDAYMADTDHLTFEEHGVYLRLLMLLWRAPECRIPNDQDWLCRRLRIDADYCTAVVMPLVKEFCQSDGNWITQKRLSKEFAYVMQKKKTNRASAKSRWNKEKTSCERNAIAGCERNAPTPTPTPTPTYKKDISPSSGDDGVRSITDEFDQEFWPAYPKKVGKGQARKAFKAARKKSDLQTLLDGIAGIDASEPRYIPHPATWLNGERWLDQPVNGHASFGRRQTQAELDEETEMLRIREHEKIRQRLRQGFPDGELRADGDRQEAET